MAVSNPGVASRDHKDRLELKPTGTGADRLAESQAALERKAALYEKLAKGEVEHEAEKYEVGAQWG